MFSLGPRSTYKERPLPTTNGSTPQRFDTIDILRGLAILAVILLHIWIRFALSGFRLNQTMPRWLSAPLLHNGGNGVTVFFAVSGFLITLTSLRRFGSLSAMIPRVFYRIRFARIGPPLLLLLAVFAALHLLHVQDFVIHKAHASLPGALLSALTFTLNWYEAGHMHSYLPACWTVLWSLSIEEMFYLFFPLLCLLLLRFRRGLPLFVTLLVAVVVSGCFARTIWTRGDDLAQENSYFAGFSDIAVGVLAALVAHYLIHRRKPIRPAVLLTLQTAGAALLLVFVTFPRWAWLKPILRPIYASGTDDTLLSLGTGLVMIASVLRNRAGRWWSAPLRWFGRHSYELYLTHEFIIVCAVNHFLKVQVTRPPGPLLAWAGAMLVLTVPVAWVVARFFSEPLNRALRPGPAPREQRQPLREAA